MINIMALENKDFSVSVRNTFQNSLQSSSISNKNLEKIIELFKENYKAFNKSIQHILLKVLPCYKQHPQSERLLKLLKTVLLELKNQITSIDSIKIYQKVEFFVVETLKFLSSGLEAKDKSVRLGCVSIIENIFFQDFQTIFDFSAVKALLIKNTKELIRDKSSMIRTMAILLSVKLGLDDEVLKISFFDPVPKNRKLALQVQSINKNSINLISEKLYDIDPEIRIEALQKLFHFGIKNLNLATKREMVLISIRDRIDKVRNFA